ncbi:MAG TPA: hypothetical protein VF125_10710 [Solirubrobacterales bacterium]
MVREGRGATHLTAVSCPSPSFCAAVSGGYRSSGKILTSTNPAGGGAGWREANAGGSVQITGVSCPAANRCVAVDNNGDVLTSSDPTAGAGLLALRRTLLEGHGHAPPTRPRPLSLLLAYQGPKFRMQARPRALPALSLPPPLLDDPGAVKRFRVVASNPIATQSAGAVKTHVPG